MSLNNIIKQKSYEKIVLICRRHPITFVPHVLFALLLLTAPFGLYWLVSNSGLNSMFQTTGGYVFVVLAGSIYYLSSYLFFYTHFVTFHLDMWIVTNDRLLDMEQKSLFYRTVSEVDLYQIQDASSEVHGFFPSIFHYGNIILQTAGPVPKFLFKNVSRPDQLREQILQLSAEDKKFHDKHHDNTPPISTPPTP